MELLRNDVAEQELDSWVQSACMSGDTDGLESLTEEVAVIVDRMIRLESDEGLRILKEVIIDLLDNQGE